MVFLLLADSGPVEICLFVCSWQLVVTCYCVQLTNNQQWPCTKVKLEEIDCLPLHLSTTITGDCFRHIMYVYILYLKCKDNILAILHMGLPITRMVNSSIVHDDNKCITAGAYESPKTAKSFCSSCIA